MKKNLTIVCILVILFLLEKTSFPQQQEVEPVKLKMISETLYEVLGGRGARGGVYIGDNGIMVIDAKMDQKSVNETIEEIKKISANPVKYLVNTHSDGDHIKGNQFYPQTVTFISHENCRNEVIHPGRDGSPSEWSNPELAPFMPSITFSDKMDIYLGSGKVELWYFGVAHTTGDAVVYIPEEKTAFLGDLFFINRPQLIHSYKGGNSYEYIKTLTKMLEKLDAEKFCSGHSDIVDRQTVKAHIDEMKEYYERVKSLVEKNKTLEETRNEFKENESRLVETIYNEIKSSE
ncbi:MAG: MBL fold metallo-hydrolase [Bacteroidales bacterium]|nr:MAG: MBL fold metallo-hydrolase [Bacteroidales bacterium]